MATDIERGAPPGGRIPVLAPGHTLATVTDQISDVVLKRPVTHGWVLGFAISFLLLQGLLMSVVMLMAFGVGVWGINHPVGWGFAIVNFVWWIGIGHAGTLISAILLLLRQQWRTSINRFAEAMTLFAVACAGLFPLLHMGRPWFFYWLLPYPNTMELWPQFRSPLVWDVFAVSTYATMSLVFWYVGLIPDLATLRDRTKYKVLQVIFGIVALGWRNSVRHWHRYEVAYLILAGLATPLVVSVHTVVSFDFSVGIVPGWHVTIFPPYFVAGAIYAGFAMVLTLCIPVRHFYNLKDFITDRHLQTMAKVTLATGLMVAYGYAIEAFGSFYSADQYENYLQKNRMLGPYFYIYWSLILCNVIAPQFLWFNKFRTNPILLFIVAMFVNVGMWLERYVIVITSLHRDFMPSAWGMYSGTIWDYATFYGTLGLFATLIFLFIRVLPAISIFEMRALVAETDAEKAHTVNHSAAGTSFARHESPKETVP
jgi:Ni/Fe-hydrogenase subunit HybB-like protein